jgi:hypothetical protein
MYPNEMLDSAIHTPLAQPLKVNTEVNTFLDDLQSPTSRRQCLDEWSQIFNQPQVPQRPKLTPLKFDLVESFRDVGLASPIGSPIDRNHMREFMPRTRR